MSFDKIKTLWRTSTENKSQQSSILEKTQKFFNSSIRKVTTTNQSIDEFEDYLATVPNTHRKHKKQKTSSMNSLKPQLIVRCYKNVEQQYFLQKYNINEDFFEKDKKTNRQRQIKMHQQLDEVEICLFNQITSRFDEILSVLRTIQSLECIATYNQEKLKRIREENMKKLWLVANKHKKIDLLLKRKQHLEKTLSNMHKIKVFANFTQIEPNILTNNTSEFYQSINQIKFNGLLYQRLLSTRNYQSKIEDFQTSLRQSFSDNLNEGIFKYIAGEMAYDEKFWIKFVYRNDIFEDRNENQSSVILDESVLVEDEVVIRPSRKDVDESIILLNIEKGWQEGEYEVENLKNKIEQGLKSLHQKFLIDFRNFCNEACQKNNKQIDNPSLPNLLREMSLGFCSKVFKYFFDLHKSFLLRLVSLAGKVLTFVYKQSMEEMNIQKKQKLSIMSEGFSNVLCFALKLIFEKCADVIQVKKIYETTDISDFKTVISVMEGIEDFIETRLAYLVQPECPETSFLKEQAQENKEKIPFQIIKKAKQSKLFVFINKMHKNAVQIQLKESLENEIWQPTDIPTFYYDSLHYLISGESLNLRRNKSNLRNNGSMMFDTSVLMDSIHREKSFFNDTKAISNFRIIRNDIIIEQKTYKVTTTVLLIVEILQDYLTLAQNFPILKDDIGQKINEILRSYNSSSSQLIVHAGAVALQKIKTKNINSRHLALSSLCLSFFLYIISCISKRIQIQECQKIQTAIIEHIETIIHKLHQILIYKINSCKADISIESTPSKGTQVIVNSTKILYDILIDYYDKSILCKIFTGEIMKIYLGCVSGIRIENRVGAESLKDDVNFFFSELRVLEGVVPDFQQHEIKGEEVIKMAFESI